MAAVRGGTVFGVRVGAADRERQARFSIPAPPGARPLTLAAPAARMACEASGVAAIGAARPTGDVGFRRAARSSGTPMKNAALGRRFASRRC
jgi:hypothetical protein